jgi:hypothetical protein
MSIQGFKTANGTEYYDYNALENIPNIANGKDGSSINAVSAIVFDGWKLDR